MEDTTAPITDSPYLRGDIARELDFYRLREAVAALAASEEGRELLLRREPCADAGRIAELKALGREWSRYLGAARQQAVCAWPPVRPLLALPGVEGAQLSREQAFALGQFCHAAMRAREALCAATDVEVPRLAALAGTLPPLDAAAAEIFAVLTPEGELRDLPAIRAIRSRIAALHREIDAAIRRYAADPVAGAALQSSMPVWRQERELLAVRADRRGAIKGIIHEVSASGQTVFIEPEEVVRANNELVQAEFELQAEERNVLRELTARLGGYRDGLAAAHAVMLELDAACAAARWQRQTGGTFADDCDLAKEPPAIRAARHPLLGEAAVPVDIGFMDGKRVLIITGPNTGGKTVTLKTVALFCLLNQAGFPVPAGEGTRLPLFTKIFADIGDEQSIDESLSTFSSHMRKVALMAEHATATSLVLLDELGSGTDPQEGGAIAMATLDALIERGSFVIATTHHGILKNYGYTNPRCINASVEFDAGTLRPTYRLLMGVPGESHAIDIARRSGLPDAIVEAARHYIATEQADVGALIRGLTAKHAELDGLLRDGREQAAKLDAKALRQKERDIELREREAALRRAEHAESGRFLREMRSQLENLVRELREGEITRAKTLAVRQFITDMTARVEEEGNIIEENDAALERDKEDVRREEERIAANGMRLGKERGGHGSSKKSRRHRPSNAEALAAATPQPLPGGTGAAGSGTPSAGMAAHGEAAPGAHASRADSAATRLFLAPGVEVYAGRERRRGILLQRNRDGTSWMVQFGAVKMSVPQTRLLPIAPATVPPAASYTVETRSSSTEDTDRPAFELRLLGMRQEEAMQAVERQLDLCAIHNFRTFSIIHGKGAGVLQQAVHDYLSHYPSVKEFHFAAPEDGGTGKTYVALF